MSANRIQSASSTAFLVSVSEQKRASRNTIFRAPKTLQEKLLVLAVCLLFIISTVFLISLWIMSNRWKASLSQLKYKYVEEDDICGTDACRETAKRLMYNMDPSTDPCVDFYQYACGGWVEKNSIPKGRQTIMVFEDRHKEVKEIIKDLIIQEVENASDTKSLRNVGKLYSACLNLDARNKNGLKSLQDLVKKYGGWPMLGDGEWNEDDFDWQKRAAKANRDLYMDIFVEIDFKNDLTDNKYYVMYFETGYFPFENPMDHDFLNENKTQEALDYIIEAARAMGSELEDDNLQQQAQEILELDFLLYNISVEMADDDEDIDIPLSKLNSQLNGDTFSYKDFINFHLQSETSIEDESILYVFHPKYFQKLPSLLDNTTKRTLANYIAFHIIFFFSEYSSDDIRKLTIGNSSKPNRTDEQECLQISKTLMPMAIGRLFVDRYFPPLTRRHVSKMVEMIRLAYSSTIDQNMWMDENTLLYALVKLQSIQSMVGYEDWILEDKLLDAYYDKLGEIQEDNYFDAVVALCEIIADDKFARWNKTALRNETDQYTSNPLIVNAYYIPSTNFISLPAGIFGYPYYKYGRIDSINYGAIGTVIGHEISHAFDTTGRKFDHLGNLRQWWTNGTGRKFLQKAECFMDQYDNYEDTLSTVKADGKVTVGENIADNGGVRNAFKAFRLHLALSGENLNYRKRLPGLSASPEQLFFLGYASIWCANMTDKYAKTFNDRDNHSPNKIRVNVPLTNFKEFAKAYHCKPGTPMNPREKCVLW